MFMFILDYSFLAHHTSAICIAQGGANQNQALTLLENIYWKYSEVANAVTLTQNPDYKGL